MLKIKLKISKTTLEILKIFDKLTLKYQQGNTNTRIKEAIKNGKVIDSFETFVNPEKPIPYNVVEVTPLSAKYFRMQDDNLFYYSKVNKDFIAEGICVDTDMNTIYTFSDTLLPSKTTGFVDPLIEQNLFLPKIISRMLLWTDSYYSMNQHIVKYGFLPWLSFCSFFLAILLRI